MVFRVPDPGLEAIPKASMKKMVIYRPGK